MERESGDHFNIKTIFPGIGIPIMKIRSLLDHLDGLAQDCSISSANALEIQQSCTMPSISSLSGLILGLRPANERRRYKVTASLIGLAQT